MQQSIVRFLTHAKQQQSLYFPNSVYAWGSNLLLQWLGGPRSAVPPAIFALLELGVGGARPVPESVPGGMPKLPLAGLGSPSRWPGSPSNISIQNVQVEFPYQIFIHNFHIEFPYIISIPNFRTECPYQIAIQNFHTQFPY